MKRILIGILIGMMIGMPLAWAAYALTWRDSSGTEMGTASNPVIIQLQ